MNALVNEVQIKTGQIIFVNVREGDSFGHSRPAVILTEEISSERPMMLLVKNDNGVFGLYRKAPEGTPSPFGDGDLWDCIISLPFLLDAEKSYDGLLGELAKI